MNGKVVSCTNLDSVRIRTLDGGRLLIVSARSILALDRVLKHCATEEIALDLEMVSDDDMGWEGWQASLDMEQEVIGDMAASPWGALVNLADRIEGRAQP